MAWQIALRLVRQGRSDEPANADEVQTPASKTDQPDEPAVVADSDDAKVEDTASDKLTADESAQGKGHEHDTETSVGSAVPDDTAASEVQVLVILLVCIFLSCYSVFPSHLSLPSNLCLSRWI